MGLLIFGPPYKNKSTPSTRNRSSGCRAWARPFDFSTTRMVVPMLVAQRLCAFLVVAPTLSWGKGLWFLQPRDRVVRTDPRTASRRRGVPPPALSRTSSSSAASSPTSGSHRSASGNRLEDSSEYNATAMEMVTSEVHQIPRPSSPPQPGSLPFRMATEGGAGGLAITPTTTGVIDNSLGLNIINDGTNSLGSDACDGFRCTICLSSQMAGGVEIFAAQNGRAANANDRVTLQPCGHRFHIDCVCEWLFPGPSPPSGPGPGMSFPSGMRQPLCPVCRQEVDKNLVRKVLRVRNGARPARVKVAANSNTNAFGFPADGDNLHL